MEEDVLVLEKKLVLAAGRDPTQLVSSNRGHAQVAEPKDGHGYP